MLNEEFFLSFYSLCPRTQSRTRELDFEYVTVDDNTLSNITRVACEPGEYAFRVRGIDPDDRMVGPWSEPSAFVVVK